MSTIENTAREDAFARRFPNMVGVVSTHYEDCYRQHSACAWHLGYDDGLASALADAPPARDDDALAGAIDTLRDMRKRERALQRLLVAFRGGGAPPQWVFDTLQRTKPTVEIADALIERHG